VSQLPGYPPTGITATAPPVTTQISSYLASNTVNPNALYSVWAGANDLFTALGNPATAQANMAIAATQLGGQVAVLNAAGARYVMLFNLPDIGRTPAFAGTSSSASVSALTGFYNSTLMATVDS
jgi:outer membrane lipase/esterase